MGIDRICLVKLSQLDFVHLNVCNFYKEIINVHKVSSDKLFLQKLREEYGEKNIWIE